MKKCGWVRLWRNAKKRGQGTIRKLLASSQIIYGSLDSVETDGCGYYKKGAFYQPVAVDK